MTFPTLGAPSSFEGTDPFWTVVFVDKVPEGQRRNAVESCFPLRKIPGAAGIFLNWLADDRAEVSLGDARFESSQIWNKARIEMSEGFEALHQREPIAALVFLDADDLAGAPKDLILHYAALKNSRGKRQRALALEALRSGEARLETLALLFVESFIEDEELSAFAKRSDAHAEQVKDAIEPILRRRMHDYNKKPGKFETLLRTAPISLLDHRAIRYTTYAGVRDLPRIGVFLRELADERPQLWQRIKAQLEETADASGALTLAFTLAELGDKKGARNQLEAGKAILAAMERKTLLWKVTIPQWVDGLEQQIK